MATTRDGRGRARTIERVVVVVSDTGGVAPVVEAAAVLAMAFGAELEGVFVREARVEDLLGLPVARIVAPRAGAAPELSRRRVERAWARHERAFRAALEGSASRAGVRWICRNVSGDVELCIADCASEGSVLALPPAGHGIAEETPAEAVLRMTRRAGAVLMTPARRGSDAGMARAGPATRIVSFEGQPRASALADEIATRTGRGHRTLPLPGASGEPGALARRLRAARPGLVLAEIGGAHGLSPPQLDELLRQGAAPVLFLKGETEPDEAA